MKFEKIKGPQNHHLFRPHGIDGKIRDVFWVRFSRNGIGRLEESLKTTHLGEAREKRDKRIASFLGQKPRNGSKVFLVEEKFPEFVEIKKGKAPATYASIKNQWEIHLKEYFGGLILDEVTGTEWLKYVNLKRRTHPDRKFFNDRKYLSMFLNWLHRDGLIQKIPKLDIVDPEIDEGKVYSKDEISRLLEKATPDLWLQIQMSLTMGMRKGEILTLEWSQIDWIKKTIFLPAFKTKIRRARTFGVSNICYLALKARHDDSKSQWVFPSPLDSSKSVGRDGNKSAWENCRDQSKVTGRFHFLRHSFLTLAFKASVNPALICEYAGLSLEEASKTYLHFSVEDTRVVADLVRF